MGPGEGGWGLMGWESQWHTVHACARRACAASGQLPPLTELDRLPLAVDLAGLRKPLQQRSVAQREASRALIA